MIPNAAWLLGLTSAVSGWFGWDNLSQLLLIAGFLTAMYYIEFKCVDPKELFQDVDHDDDDNGPPDSLIIG